MPRAGCTGLRHGGRHLFFAEVLVARTPGGDLVKHENATRHGLRNAFGVALCP